MCFDKVSTFKDIIIINQLFNYSINQLTNKSMKKLFNIIVCVLLVIGAQSVKAQNNETNFSVTVYTAYSKSETSFDEKHPLCGSLNGSWNMFHSNFRRVNKMSVGFSGQAVEIHKPAIYNAVVKTEKYIRKAVSKGDIRKEEAVATLKHILECANALAMEHDTKAFEKEIASAKTPELIIRFFSQVVVEYV